MASLALTDPLISSCRLCHLCAATREAEVTCSFIIATRGSVIVTLMKQETGGCSFFYSELVTTCESVSLSIFLLFLYSFVLPFVSVCLIWCLSLCALLSIYFSMPLIFLCDVFSIHLWLESDLGKCGRLTRVAQ